MRLRIGWDRSSLTVDLTRTPGEQTAENPGTEYVPAAQVERSEPTPIGFTVDPLSAPEPTYRRAS